MPARFGKYILLKEIEMGGMAAVYLAKARGIGGFEKFLAIKRIFPQLSRSEDFVEMFITEARIASELNHSNISHIYDLGQEEGDYFIAMEYIHGKDTFRLLRRCKQQSRSVPVPLACYIVQQTLQALDYAHRKRDHSNNPMNIVHRDVSPRNVLISYEGQVKLIDFGIAKASVQNSHTRAGTIKGKVNYMSPEQARGEEIDARSDLFSVGLLLYELLFQVKLFKGSTEIHTLELIKECQLPDFRKHYPDLPEELELILTRALARDRAQRFQNAQEFLHELNQYLSRYSTVAGGVWMSEFMQDCFAPEIAGEQRELEAFRTIGEDPQSYPGFVAAAAVPHRATGGTPLPQTLVQPMPEQGVGARQTLYAGPSLGAGGGSLGRGDSGLRSGSGGFSSPSNSGQRNAPVDDGSADDLAASDLQTSVEIQTGNVAASAPTQLRDTASNAGTSPTSKTAPSTAGVSASGASNPASPVPAFGAGRAGQNKGGQGSMLIVGAALVLLAGGGAFWASQSSSDHANPTGSVGDVASNTSSSGDVTAQQSAGSSTGSTAGSTAGSSPSQPTGENNQNLNGQSGGQGAANAVNTSTGVSTGRADAPVSTGLGQEPSSAQSSGSTQTTATQTTAGATNAGSTVARLPASSSNAPGPSGRPTVTSGAGSTAAASVAASGSGTSASAPLSSASAPAVAGSASSAASPSAASPADTSRSPSANATGTGVGAGATESEKAPGSSGSASSGSTGAAVAPASNGAGAGGSTAGSGSATATKATDVKSIGFLNINASETCVVRLDGVVIGNTPLKGVKTSAGAHKIEIESLTDHATKTFNVNVSAQQVLPVVWRREQ